MSPWCSFGGLSFDFGLSLGDLWTLDPQTHEMRKVHHGGVLSGHKPQRVA